MNQPDISKIFERHVEKSNKPRVSGYFDVWICGLNNKWIHPELTDGQARLLIAVCADRGEQVHNTQWDFTPEDFADYVAPIYSKQAAIQKNIAELGFGQYL